MTDQRTSIVLQGINTSAPDEMLQDGATEDIYNLRFKNGGLEQVYNHTLLEPIDHDHSPIKPENIVLKPTFLADHHYLVYSPRVITSSAQPGRILQVIATTDESENRILSLEKTVFTFPSYEDSPVSIDDISVVQYGNLIYITYGENEYVYLYKMGNYLRVNMAALPDITFNTEQRYHSLTDDVGGQMIYSHSDYKATANIPGATEVLTVDLTYQNGIEEVKNIIDTYATHIGELNSLGYIVGEFKIALAYKLYDGSIIKASKPKLVTSFLKKEFAYTSMVAGSGTLPYTIAGIYTDTDNVTGKAFYDYLTGMYVNVKDIPQTVRNAIDGNVITELVILITRPTLPYKYHDLYYEERRNNYGFENGRSLVGMRFGLCKRMSRKDIMDTERYKKTEDIWYELKKVDFDNLDTSCNLEHDTVKDVEHNPVVPVNYSHHDITSRSKFDFNSRLHRWAVRNSLYAGYNYGLGSVSSTDYLTKKAKEYLRVKYGTEQQHQTTATISYISQSGANQFAQHTYTDRHGERITGYFPVFKFSSTENIQPEEGVSITVKYTFTRNGISGSVERKFENVQLTIGSSNEFIDDSLSVIASANEVSGGTVSTSMDSGYPVITNTAHTYKYINISEASMFALVTVKVNDSFVIQRKDFTGWTFVLSGNTYYAVDNYVVYPDSRAQDIRFGIISGSTTYISDTYKLTADDGNNQGFAFLNPTPIADAASASLSYYENSGTLAPAFAFRVHTTTDTIPATNTPVREVNKLYVSAINNPFYVAPENIYAIGQVSTIIRHLEASIEHVSETKFGYYPLYVFCNDGIYSMEQGGEIVYQSIQKISGEVKLNNTGTVAVGTSVLFIGSKGLMELSNRQAQCISDALDKYNAMTRYDDTLAEWRTYMLSAQIHYNQQEREIVVYNPSYGYAYIFSLIAKQWTRRAYSGRMIDGLRTLVSTAGVADLWQENRSSILSTAKVYTRAIKFGSHEFKRIRRAILREKHGAGTTYSLILQGSNNLSTWYSIQTRTTDATIRLLPASYKYYRLLLIVNVVGHFSTTGIDVEYYNRFVNKMR